MAKKGTVGYYAQLERRKINRQINNLNKEKQRVGIEKPYKQAELDKEINRLQQLKQSTYQRVKEGDKWVKTGRTAEEVKENIKGFNIKISQEEINRRNMQFLKDIKEPFNKDTKSVSKFSQMEVRIFFAATKRAWEGKEPGERLQAIRDYYGVDNLYYFFSKVLAANEKALIQGITDNFDMLMQDEGYMDAASVDNADGSKYDSAYMSAIVEMTV